MFNKIIIQQMHALPVSSLTLNPNFYYNYTGSVDVTNVSYQIAKLGIAVTGGSFDIDVNLIASQGTPIITTKEQDFGATYGFNSIKPVVSVAPNKFFIYSANNTSSNISILSPSSNLSIGSKLWVEDVSIKEIIITNLTTTPITMTTTDQTGSNFLWQETKLFQLNSTLYMIGIDWNGKVNVYQKDNTSSNIWTKVANLQHYYNGEFYFFSTVIVNNVLYMATSYYNSAILESSILIYTYDGTTLAADTRYIISGELRYNNNAIWYDGTNIKIAVAKWNTITNVIKVYTRVNSTTLTFSYNYSLYSATVYGYNQYCNIKTVLCGSIRYMVISVDNYKIELATINSNSMTHVTSITYNATSTLVTRELVPFYNSDDNTLYIAMSMNTNSNLSMIELCKLPIGTSTMSFVNNFTLSGQSNGLTMVQYLGDTFFVLSDAYTSTKTIKIFYFDTVIKKLVLYKLIPLTTLCRRLTSIVYNGQPILMMTDNTGVLLYDFIHNNRYDITSFTSGYIGSLPLSAPVTYVSMGGQKIEVSGHATTLTPTYLQSNPLIISKTNNTLNITYQPITVPDTSRYTNAKITLQYQDILSSFRLILEAF